MPRSNLTVSPIDSTRMGMPSTRQTQRADSARNAVRTDSTTTTTTTTTPTDSTRPPR